MIIYDKFVFASPPRTGSSWFMAAAEMSGMKKLEGVLPHHPPPAKHDGFVVSIVRHPYEWLISYYRALGGSEIGVPEVDVLAHCGRLARNTDEFLQLYLTNHRGCVGKIFDVYAAATVYRVEDFPWCALELFHACGADMQQLSKAAKIEIQNHHEYIPEALDPKIRTMVMRAERDFCQRYDYT